MATVPSTVTNLVDSGIGPLAVTNSTVDNFDIDDFVHTATRSECIKLQLINAIDAADPTLAKDRPPLNIDNHIIGGF